MKKEPVDRPGHAQEYELDDTLHHSAADKKTAKVAFSGSTGKHCNAS